MFYVTYVLAILCGTAFGLKIHSPSMGMVVANQAVNVTWSRQHHSDPTSVLFMLENLIGGGLSPVANSSSAHTITQMQFPEAGTFRMWAVNPANSTQSYAMSDIFVVTPNNLEASDGNDGNDTSNPSQPQPNSPDGADLGQPSVPASPSHSGLTASNKLPYIIGAAVGGFVLLLILIAVLVHIIRRRARVTRRTTFHRNRMVRSLPPLTFAIPRNPMLDSPQDEKDGVQAQYESRGRQLEERPPMGPYPFARTA
ncbi:hypothetical protein MSAN_01111600 [Mycena sanguinolenta]|uniref:Uncharacterized protein n=1 Tax=Mycena sanguinolenta TaxID=230812 RepID=A0A8H7D6P2_9AGAR|nr:hypothetical protein MSAN_01111600 [Mycena sanguinolenta]